MEESLKPAIHHRVGARSAEAVNAVLNSLGLRTTLVCVAEVFMAVQVDRNECCKHFAPRFPETGAVEVDSSLSQASKLNMAFVFQKVAADSQPAREATPPGWLLPSIEEQADKGIPRTDGLKIPGRRTSAPFNST